MTFTGTLANINAALDGLTFSPTANFNGAATAHHRPPTTRATPAPAVPRPTPTPSRSPSTPSTTRRSTRVPGAQTTNEDTAIVFSLGQRQPHLDRPDVDAETRGGRARSRSPVTNGTLTLAGTTGLTFTTGDGTADATMTFTGTPRQHQRRPGGLTFTPTADFNGPALAHHHHRRPGQHRHRRCQDRHRHGRHHRQRRQRRPEHSVGDASEPVCAVLRSDRAHHDHSYRHRLGHSDRVDDLEEEF